MRIAVTGGRALNDRELVNATLNGFHSIKPITMLISGGCPPQKIAGKWYMSADRLAEEWARTHGVDTLIRHAKWDKYRKGAGPRRNERMMRDRPQTLIAFPGGAGTADCCKRAREHGIEIHRVQKQKGHRHV